MRPLSYIARICGHVGTCCSRGVTLVCFVLSPIVVVTRAVVTWAVASLVTWVAAAGVLLSPTPLSYFPCFRDGSIRVVYSKLGVKE